MGLLISTNQTTFILGRQIMNGVLVTNKILDFAKRYKRTCLVCKVDFAQAYDSIDWNFLKFMLKRMGLGDRWLKWMEATVFMSSMWILVNGSPTHEFQVSRGLRQGDPLSPFLFTIVVEGLAGMVRQAVRGGLYNRFKLAESVEYSLLQFADDTILFGDGS